MKNLDLDTVMKSLAKKRPIYHSEADFQFSLAYEIKCCLGDCVDIRCEYPADNLSIDEKKGRSHLDIQVSLNGKTIPIELKYRTIPSKENIDGEEFDLKNQGAPDWSRYDFLKDVWRVEKFKMINEQCDEGYAILLTNDSSFEEDPKTSPLLKLTGTIGGVKYQREFKSAEQEAAPIDLKFKYAAEWKEYCSEYHFRYLVVKV